MIPSAVPHPGKRFPATFRSRTPRLLTAVPICDGHDSAIVTLNLEFVRQGIEVIYLGYHRSARDIVRAAVQEDVQAIGISSYNGGHLEFFSEVRRLLRAQSAEGIGLFGGGGGTITPADATLMKRRGVDEIFFAGTPLARVAADVRRLVLQSGAKLEPPCVGCYDRLGRDPAGSALVSDRHLGRMLTAVEAGILPSRPHALPSAPCIGIAGPGGAGKSTLIDELALRFLKARPHGRLAILSHDPSLARRGALLADRATMIYAQDDRVFMRSLGTRGRSGGLSSATRGCLEILKRAGFQMVLVESAGIGQEDAPFAGRLVDKTVLVMSPDYGSRLQLQKIVMLETADAIVVNKCDLPGARTATTEIAQRLASNSKGQKLVSTVAKRHRDPGVDELFKNLLP